MNIVFVDDEPMVLSGIERALFDKDWDINCFTEGSEAVSFMLSEQVDIVVSDMRMPKMGGAELLERVCCLSPATVRIVLSGQTDQEASIKACMTAHYWLDKPCDNEQLSQLLERIEAGLNQMPSAEVKTAIGRIKHLPSPPKVYIKVREILDSDSISMEKLSGAISEDPALTAKVLQLTNSSFFTRGKVVENVHDAIMRLGLETVSKVVLIAEAYSNIQENPLFDIYEVQAHSFATAQLASQLVEADLQQEAMLAGLLHRIGESILLLAYPDKIDEYLSYLKDNPSTTHYDAQNLIFKTNHAQLGGYLLLLWGFSIDVVEAVLYHRNVDHLLGDKFGVAAALYVADRLLQKKYIDEKLIDHFSLQDRLVQWTPLAESISMAKVIG